MNAPGLLLVQMSMQTCDIFFYATSQCAVLAEQHNKPVPLHHKQTKQTEKKQVLFNTKQTPASQASHLQADLKFHYPRIVSPGKGCGSFD